MKHIDVGYARRAHGITGEVVVRPTTDDPLRWSDGAMLLTDESPPRSLEVASVRPHHDDLLVKFASIEDRDAAEMLRGVTFRIRADERRSLGDHEFWPDQLIGSSVIDGAGNDLGTVIDVEFGPAQDRLLVRTDAGDVAVPLVAEIVPSVDMVAGEITVVPPQGLFGSPTSPRRTPKP